MIPPLAFVTRGVSRTRGVKFAELETGRTCGSTSTAPPTTTPHDDLLHPAVIQVHGGGWLAGSRYEQGIPLLNHLASIGWVGFNIDYRLSPQATLPDHIVDVKRAIAWVRENAGELGIDPEMICITGGSAGGHLTALAGLTINDPDSSPASRRPTRRVAAAVPFYGIYDLTNLGGHYYPEIREWVLERIVVKRPVDEAERALPQRLADVPGARRCAALPRHPRRPRHARPGRRRPRLRRAPARGLGRARSPTSSSPAPSTPSTSGPPSATARISRGHRPVPHRDRRGARQGTARGRRGGACGCRLTSAGPRLGSTQIATQESATG